MFNNKFITYNFFTRKTEICKWKLQNNRFTEQKSCFKKTMIRKQLKFRAGQPEVEGNMSIP